MNKYNNKAEVDKLSSLKKELSELEEQSLRNMDKVIERGEKIEILVKKSETLADQSYDLRDTSRKVKNKMWWKNKKVMIGIIAVVLIVIIVIIIIATRWSYPKILCICLISYNHLSQQSFSSPIEESLHMSCP